MTALQGALKWRDHAIRVVPHGRLHDEYQRGDILCPGELSVAAIVLSPNGGHRYEVRTSEAEIAAACHEGEHYWIARCKPWDRAQPFIVIRDPVPWSDINWLPQECELTLLTWLRNSNHPSAWQLPGLKRFMRRRSKHWIKRIGKKEFREQSRKFWGSR